MGGCEGSVAVRILPVGQYGDGGALPRDVDHHADKHQEANPKGYPPRAGYVDVESSPTRHKGARIVLVVIEDIRPPNPLVMMLFVFAQFRDLFAFATFILASSPPSRFLEQEPGCQSLKIHTSVFSSVHRALYGQLPDRYAPKSAWLLGS